jgi:hypothetical protein
MSETKHFILLIWNKTWHFIFLDWQCEPEYELFCSRDPSKNRLTMKTGPSMLSMVPRVLLSPQGSLAVKFYGLRLMAKGLRRLYPVFRGFYMCLGDVHALPTRGTALGSRIPLVSSNFPSQNMSIYGNLTMPNCVVQIVTNQDFESTVGNGCHSRFRPLTLIRTYPSRMQANNTLVHYSENKSIFI